MSILNKYIGLSFTYGFLRKIIYTNYEKKEKPVLLTDNIMIYTWSGIRCIAYFPLDIIMDIRNIEIISRKIKQIDNYEYEWMKINHYYDVPYK